MYPVSISRIIRDLIGKCENTSYDPQVFLLTRHVGLRRDRLWLLSCTHFGMTHSKDSAPHLATGRKGEDLAVRYLRLRGYRILERNFRCKLGEIDIIAKKAGVTIFVEVKTRREPYLMDPINAVDGRKVARTINAARCYLLAHRAGDIPCRFDVLTLSVSSKGRAKINHLQDAFHLTDDTVIQGRISWARSLRKRIYPKRKRKE
ncbi:MAG TPA: YraN family protein [Proteobacteria bacterium]|nr:hypothetical protein BMS3Abin14_00551 [bacterium BMS3Abin14]HDL52962.1 YraN family protein [Pseudomonadota bacterium]